MQEPWPALTADDFDKTSYLLHRGLQIIGKLMLSAPFDPHWAHLAMPLTSRGLTTGLIPYGTETFSIDIDFFTHEILISTSTGERASIQLKAMTVNELEKQIFTALHKLGITLSINEKPQEVSNAIPFHEDTAPRVYEEKTVHTWWRIMLSTTRVLLKYHAKFYGITPKIGLFWGTLDLRDARYKGVHLPGPFPNFIARNAMDDVQFEVGWSASNEKYPLPSFFAYAYPKPEGYEKAAIEPKTAKWVTAINEFVLDYDDLRKSKDPEADLMRFFESTYKALGWDPQLTVTGQPLQRSRKA